MQICNWHKQFGAKLCIWLCLFEQNKYDTPCCKVLRLFRVVLGLHPYAFLCAGEAPLQTWCFQLCFSAIFSPPAGAWSLAGTAVCLCPLCFATLLLPAARCCLLHMTRLDGWAMWATSKSVWTQVIKLGLCPLCWWNSQRKLRTAVNATSRGNQLANPNV